MVQIKCVKDLEGYSPKLCWGPERQRSPGKPEPKGNAQSLILTD